MDLNIDFYKNQFYEEAFDILDKVADDVLKAESTPDNKTILNSIFRGIHTIKGSAGSFDLTDISNFAHYLETLLSALRDEKIKLDSSIVDIILDYVDELTNLIQKCKNNQKYEINKEIINKVQNLLNNSIDKKDIEENKTDIVKKEEQIDKICEKKIDIPENIFETLKNLSNKGFYCYKILLNWSNEYFCNGYDPVVFLKNLRKNCEYYYADNQKIKIPDFLNLKLFELFLLPELYVATKLSINEIKDLILETELISIEEINFDKIIEKEDSSKLFFKIHDIPKEVINEFVISSMEMFDSIEQAILDYEKKGEKDALNKILRTIHTIKGDSGYLGIEKLSIYAHNIETILINLRDGKYKKSRQINDIILESIDEIKKIIKGIGNGKTGFDKPKNFDIIIEILNNNYQIEEDNASYDAYLSKSDEIISVFVEQITQYKEMLSLYIDSYNENESNKKAIIRTLESIIKSSKYVELVYLTDLATLTLDFVKNNNKEEAVKNIKRIIDFISKLLEKPRKIGEILIEENLINQKDLNDALSQQKLIGEILVESGKVKKEDIDDALKVQKIAVVAQNIPKQQEISQEQKEIKSMRIDETKIENFSNLIGEFVIAKNSYDFIISELSNNKDIPINIIKILKENFQLFSRISVEMQNQIMALRMVPIKGIFRKYERVVRDIARKQNKEIRLVTIGEETEIDKKIADVLNEPLIHLVRNSCDHGIETPSERVNKGKIEVGTVTLSAGLEGRNIIIKVIDDGRGIDKRKIYEKALTMGLIGIDEKYDINNLPDSIYDIIFLPGFSTKSEVTDISGRGVGMDVVMSNIKSFGGNVKIKSQPDIGTEITITIPMSMGITQVLMLSDANKKYAIPLDYILETIKIKTTQLHKIKNNYGFNYRGSFISVVKLDNLLYEKNIGLNIDNQFEEEISIIVLKIQKGKFGIIVDKFYKNIEVAIKPMPDQLSYIKFISGITILGDGEVIPVLNPNEIV